MLPRRSITYAITHQHAATVSDTNTINSLTSCWSCCCRPCQLDSMRHDFVYVRDVVTAQVDKDERDVEVECKCQLLLVLAEVTLDGSTPLICSPLCATLFCQAASGAVPISPHTKVSPPSPPPPHAPPHHATTQHTVSDKPGYGRQSCTANMHCLILIPM